MPSKKVTKETSKNVNRQDIETLLKSLDKITEEMESEKCTLEKSFELYKKGLEITKNAKEALEEIEGKIKILEEE